MFISSQRIQRDVYSILESEDVEINTEGEAAVHGRTDVFWTASV